MAKNNNFSSNGELPASLGEEEGAVPPPLLRNDSGKKRAAPSTENEADSPPKRVYAAGKQQLDKQDEEARPKHALYGKNSGKQNKTAAAFLAGPQTAPRHKRTVFGKYTGKEIKNTTLSLEEVDGDTPRHARVKKYGGRAGSRPTGLKLPGSGNPFRNYPSAAGGIDDDNAGDEAIIPQVPSCLSVHELMKAGENSMFLREMQQLMGHPDSSVLPGRIALLELSGNMQSNDFLERLLSSVFWPAFVNGIGLDPDIIACFCSLGALLFMLGSPRLGGRAFHQLNLSRLPDMVGPMLMVTDDIRKIASLPSTNMRESARASLSKLVDELVRRAELWEQGPVTSTDISPRLLSLKLLQMLSVHARDADYVSMFEALTDSLFLGIEQGGPEAFTAAREVDVALSLSLLHLYSDKAVAVGGAPAWNASHLPAVVAILDECLRWPVDDHTETHLLVLELSVDMTNGSREAATAFGKDELILRLGENLRHYFGLYSRDGGPGVVDSARTILTISLLINILELNRRSRSALYRHYAKKEEGPLPALIDAFLDVVEKDRSEQQRIAKERRGAAPPPVTNQPPTIEFLMPAFYGYLALGSRVRQLLGERRSSEGSGYDLLLWSIRNVITTEKAKGEDVLNHAAQMQQILDGLRDYNFSDDEEE